MRQEPWQDRVKLGQAVEIGTLFSVLLTLTYFNNLLPIQQDPEMSQDWAYLSP